MTNIESQVIRILLEQYKKDNGKKIESLLGKYPKFFEEVYNEYGKHDDLNDFISQLKQKHPECFEDDDFQAIFGDLLSEVREKVILDGLKTLAKDCPEAFEDSAFENILKDLLSKGQNKEQTLGILSVLNSIDKGHRTDKGILTGLTTLAKDCPKAFADDTLKNILKDLVKDKNKEQALGILDVLNSIDKSYRTDEGILTGLKTLAEDCPEAFEKDNFKNSLKELLLKGQEKDLEISKKQTLGILSVLNSIDKSYRTDKGILTGLNTLAEDCPEAFADDTLKNILKDLVKDKNKEQTLGILDVLNSIDKSYRTDEGILTGLTTLAKDCPEAFEKDNFKNSLKELVKDKNKEQTSGILSVLNSIDKSYRTDEGILTSLNTLAKDCPYIFEDRKDDANYKSGCEDIIKLLQATKNNSKNDDKPERILNVLSLLKTLDRENFFSQYTHDNKEANLSQDSRCNKQIYDGLTELAQKDQEAFATENIKGLEGFLGGSDVFQMVGKLDLLNSLSNPLNTTKLELLTELIDGQTGSNVITDESGKQITFSTFLKNKGGEALKSLDSLNASSTEEEIRKCKTKLEELKKQFITTPNSPSTALGDARAQPVGSRSHIVMQ